MARLNLSPQATGLLPGGEHSQCNANTTRESKMAATFSFYPCGWFFSSILSSQYFYSSQPQRSFEWRSQKEILKYEKCIKWETREKPKLVRKWNDSLFSRLLFSAPLFLLRFFLDIMDFNLLRTLCHIATNHLKSSESGWKVWFLCESDKNVKRGKINVFRVHCWHNNSQK